MTAVRIVLSFEAMPGLCCFLGVTQCDSRLLYNMDLRFSCAISLHTTTCCFGPAAVVLCLVGCWVGACVLLGLLCFLRVTPF